MTKKLKKLDTKKRICRMRTSLNAKVDGEKAADEFSS